MENKCEIGGLLRNKRLELNLTMNSVARQIGVTRSTLSSIENGNGNYTIDILLELLRVLHLSMDIDASSKTINRQRATRTTTVEDKKINRFIVMCVEQYASFSNQGSAHTYKLLNESGIIDELKEDYEDMHGMSVLEINEYIRKRLKGGVR